jgi:transposase-like protein
MRGGAVVDCLVAGKVGGRARIGGVAGEVNEKASVSGCHSTAAVAAKENAVGGVAGPLDKGSLPDCSTDCEAKGFGNSGGVGGAGRGGGTRGCHAAGAVAGNSFIGGVAGEVIDNGGLSGCHSTAMVTATANNVGGVAGLVQNSGVVDCHSSGAVTGDSWVGGVAGIVRYGGNVDNSDSTGRVNGDSRVGGVAGALAEGGISGCHSRDCSIGIDAGNVLCYYGGMNCTHCTSSRLVKNGKSRHGHQRWLCSECGKTCGQKDYRRVDPEKKASALQHYLEGVGLRATERLVGVSHNSVMNWVLEEVEGKALERVKASEVEWVEADELWTYVGKKKRIAGCGGLLIVLPRKSADGRWAIVEPRRPGVWMRNFLMANTSSTAPTSGIPTESSSNNAGTFKARRTHSP